MSNEPSELTSFRVINMKKKENTELLLKYRPLIVAKGMQDVQVYDVVHVSDKHLIGEVIELRDDLASIQVYEETAGIGPGEPVYFTNLPLSAELGPGLIEGIFDGFNVHLIIFMKLLVIPFH